MTVSTIDGFARELLGGAPCIETIPGAELAPSPIHGRGLFAKRAWAPGEVLCILDGQVVDVARHPAVIDALEWNALGPELLLVRPLRTSYGFINHSPRPNLVIDEDGHTMRACAPIRPQDELTLDYFAQPVPPVYLAGTEAATLRRSGETSTSRGDARCRTRFSESPRSSGSTIRPKRPRASTPRSSTTPGS